MRILVTGGAGFIGSNFVHYWLKKHPADKITVLDLLTYAGNLENLSNVAKNKNYQFVKGDIRATKTVDQLMAKTNLVVHFAAESHVDRSITGPAEFIQTNIVGTQILLDTAVKHKIKHFHHVSTDEVYGSLPLNSGQKFTETSQLSPNSPYAASKAASDLLVRAYHQTYGLRTTITNTSNNYGPYQYPEKLIPLMTLNALHNRPLPVYGDGKNVRDWIHVEDHCRGIDLVIKKGQPGETYCIGGDSEQSNIIVVKKILAILKAPKSLITYVKDRPGHDRRYAIDSAKVKKLGFKHAHTFDSGLKATVEWYLQHRDWWESLLNQEYKKYYQKQYETRWY